LEELYTQPYESINFVKQRNNVHELDIYCPHHPVLDALNNLLVLYENIPQIPVLSSYLPLRKASMKRVYNLIIYEDENTGFQDLAPVNKAFNMVCRYIGDGPNSEAFKAHMSRIDDFLWMSKDGMTMTGTNGSQLWDLAFMAQAAVETGLADEEENKECVLGMLDWLDQAQIREDPKWYQEGYRHRTKGAWAYSTPEQGYVV